MGVTHVQSKLGDQSQMLQFHVIAGKIQPILGYPGLKEMHMEVDCGKYFLVSQDGKKLLCHEVRVKEEEKGVTSKGFDKESQRWAQKSSA